MCGTSCPSLLPYMARLPSVKHIMTRCACLDKRYVSLIKTDTDDKITSLQITHARPWRLSCPSSWRHSGIAQRSGQECNLKLCTGCSGAAGDAIVILPPTHHQGAHQAAGAPFLVRLQCASAATVAPRAAKRQQRAERRMRQPYGSHAASQLVSLRLRGTSRIRRGGGTHASPLLTRSSARGARARVGGVL
eukprot:TRINITY_DN16275_c0_g1_i1.p1 TRINITY_DN16275_c0_g1~~TRINITY_DN16275_c0_g1_i1.p1  ORF type:complete len:191 (-),score=8.06 TRINITY_DN16275_c0_g1_i1:105-677(-)